MTDHRGPAAPPPAGSPSTNAPTGDPAASAPQGGAAAGPPGPSGAPPVQPTDPGKTMGIVALVQSRKAGYSNRWAVAAIIISSVLMVLTIIVAIIAGMALGSGRW